MVSFRRELVYSLLIAIGLLIAGLVALLWVSNTREQHLQDELSDLRRTLNVRNAEIRQLQQQLLKKPEPTDTSWDSWPADTLNKPH